MQPCHIRIYVTLAVVQFLILFKNKHLQLYIAGSIPYVIPDINLGFNTIEIYYFRPI